MTLAAPDTAVPDVVRARAAGAAITPVWRNELGGVTFRLGDGPDRRFMKWMPRSSVVALDAEAKRLAWAARTIRVPRVLEHGGDGHHEWLVTAGIPGESAVSPRWIGEPAVAVRAVGEGLRALHDALPVTGCPFDWSVAARIADARRRNLVVPDALRHPPSVDRLVVCHGDACCPNTLLDDAGLWSGHVDLGALGVADRWADIAVAAMSTQWNYGPGWEDALLEAYGVTPNRERLAYYRDLWNAT
jgi:kanamycin kinase